MIKDRTGAKGVDETGHGLKWMCRSEGRAQERADTGRRPTRGAADHREAEKKGRHSLRVRLRGRLRASGLAGVVILCLAGCATAPIALRNGRPEVNLDAPRRAVSAMIANAYSAHGFSISQASEFTVVAEKPDASIGAALLFGSRMAGTPNVRVTLSFSDAGSSTHVIARVEMVSNPSSGFEHVTDISSSASNVQMMLDDLKSALEGGAVGLIVGDDMSITATASGSPAANAGLRTGDHLISVDHSFVASKDAANQKLRGASGSNVDVEVRRGEQTIAVTLTRKPYLDIYGPR